MDKNIQTLLDLLKVVLFNQPMDVSIDDPKTLYRMAKENGLSGTIYPVVKDKISEPVILSRFQKDFYKYVSDDEKKLALVEKISEIFNQNGIDHVFLKGSHLKHIYPKTYMRSMGDIDVLVKADRIKFAGECLVNAGFDFISERAEHDTYEFGNVEVEVHRAISVNVLTHKESLLEDVWHHVELKSENRYQLQPEFETTYLLHHLKAHMLMGGVGVRNVIDIGIFLDHMKNIIKPEILKELLTQQGYQIFFMNIVYSNEKYLDIYLKEYRYFPIEYDENLFHLFTNYIIRSGVHGLGMDFNTFTSRFASQKKHRSVLNMVFPSYALMKYRYPKMMKLKILLPLAWFRRWIYVAFYKSKRALGYFKLIKKVDKTEVENTSELFKKMGI